MKNYSLLSLSLVAVVVAGCSDQNSTKAPAINAVVAAPIVQKITLAQDIPAGMKGFSFELGGKCAVDLVNKPQKDEVITINRKDGMTVDGWAFDDKNGKVPSLVALQLAKGADRYHALLNRYGGREDLSKAFGKPEFANAGYRGTVDIEALPAGQYDILIIQKGEGKNMVCATYRKLEVKI